MLQYSVSFYAMYNVRVDFLYFCTLPVALRSHAAGYAITLIAHAGGQRNVR